MSFSKEVKKQLTDAQKNAFLCCKEAFSAGASGLIPDIKCKRCKIQYISGIFCSFGTMSDPTKSFQLFLYPPENVFSYVSSILEEITPPKTGNIKGKKCLYYKSCEGVGDFLAFCKATAFSMRVFEAGVVSEEKLRIQRVCNADVANLNRVTAAAEEQLFAIKLLRKHNMIDSLKNELIEAAELREANPEAGLSELVKLSSYPIGKSGMNYRLKQLVTLAKKLKTEDNV